MDRRFLGILAAVVIVLVGVFAISQHSSNKSSGSGNSSGQASYHVRGADSTGVKLQEYGDYECPVCGIYYSTVNQVYDQFSKQILFQFSNLPLSQIHPNAFAAARAAEAAGLQGKYWQMHDQLYTNQDPTGASGWVASSNPLDNYFVKYAQTIGLDITKFKTDYASDQVNSVINADVAAFSKTGQQEATPSFFLDGKYIPNSVLVDSSNRPSAEKFAAVINAEIAKKQKQ